MKIDPEIYRKAAERVFLTSDYSCHIIKKLARGDDLYSLVFSSLFEPAERNLSYDKTHYGWFGERCSDNYTNHRITALLLMAEIAEDLK